MKKLDRTGEIYYNNFGSKMKIIEYKDKRNIKVYFEEYDWVSDWRNFSDIQRGTFKCPFEPRIYNIGFVGEGKYNSKDNRDIYQIWKDVLKRCYDSKYHKKYPTYKDCEVCEEWLNFQNFAKWYEENYYEIENNKMRLDKDILYKGNKIYSPNTCAFVPERINNLFEKANGNRGEYPIGIGLHKKTNTLRVRCQDKNMIQQTLGYFQLNQVEEAFQVYKRYKEKVIKEVADEYKPYISKELYDAMYRYEVEITD